MVNFDFTPQPDFSAYFNSKTFSTDAVKTIVPQAIDGPVLKIPVANLPQQSANLTAKQNSSDVVLIAIVGVIVVGAILFIVWRSHEHEKFKRKVNSKT